VGRPHSHEEIPFDWERLEFGEAMKTTISVEATQWFKDGDHPDVRCAGPRIKRRGEGYYISGMYPLANAWIEYERRRERPQIDKNTGGIFAPMIAEFQCKDGALYYRHIWPFSMWKFRGEQVESDIAEDDVLFQDAMMIENQFFARNNEPRVPHGWLSPPAIDGRVVVYPGDWIVDINGKRHVLSDEEYKKLYQAEGQP
jgi:hypothetical protein